jgi:DNA polymerase
VITVEERASELYEVVRACTLCPLSATRTLAVPGEGPLDAEIMCIGEAPGVNEDKQGRPFVGAAGQFLSELLAAAGLVREDVYICNVLKCRPPANRDPLPDEIEACSEYLDLQLDLVDPLVVITLGRFSMSKWFPQQAISRIHGSVKEVDGRLIVPMYHPAAALHQGSLRQVMLDDFAKLPAVLERARRQRDTEPNVQPLSADPPATSVSGADLAVSGSTARGAAEERPVEAELGPTASESGPPWEDAPPAGFDTEVEFDPGELIAPQGALASRSTEPDFVSPVRAAAAAVTGPEPQEPTAEQGAAPAAKQTQLSLFE